MSDHPEQSTAEIEALASDNDRCSMPYDMKAELMGWGSLIATAAIDFTLYKTGCLTPIKEHVTELFITGFANSIGLVVTAAAFTESSDYNYIPPEWHEQ